MVFSVSKIKGYYKFGNLTMFNKKSKEITKENTIYVFIDASNLWEAQKAKGKFFDYQKLRNFIKTKLNASSGGESIEEKGNMDVEITIDVLHHIAKYDIAVFFTGDSDFLALVTYLRTRGKKVYIFVDDTIDISQFENYPFIQSWINTSCPRIGTDDIMNTEKVLINIREALIPEKTLEELENVWK